MAEDIKEGFRCLGMVVVVIIFSVGCYQGLLDDLNNMLKAGNLDNLFGVMFSMCILNILILIGLACLIYSIKYFWDGLTKRGVI